MSEIRLSSDIYWEKVEEKIIGVINIIMLICWVIGLITFGMFISSASAEELNRFNHNTVTAYEALIKADREYRTPEFVLEGIRNAKTPQEVEEWLKEDAFLWKEFRRPLELEFRLALCQEFGEKNCKRYELEMPLK